MTGTPHVGGEMQARALTAVTDELRPDSIAPLVLGGHHREALAQCARDHGHVLEREAGGRHDPSLPWSPSLPGRWCSAGPST